MQKFPGKELIYLASPRLFLPPPEILFQTRLRLRPGKAIGRRGESHGPPSDERNLFSLSQAGGNAGSVGSTHQRPQECLRAKGRRPHIAEIPRSPPRNRPSSGRGRRKTVREEPGWLHFFRLDSLRHDYYREAWLRRSIPAISSLLCPGCWRHALTLPPRRWRCPGNCWA